MIQYSAKSPTLQTGSSSCEPTLTKRCHLFEPTQQNWWYSSCISSLSNIVPIYVEISCCWYLFQWSIVDRQVRQPRRLMEPAVDSDEADDENEGASMSERARVGQTTSAVKSCEYSVKYFTVNDSPSFCWYGILQTHPLGSRVGSQQSWISYF